MKYKNNILELIGHTPLVKLNKLTRGMKPLVLAKIESLNPGGSVKDRIGQAMIDRAEQLGELKPGGTVVEATSGNKVADPGVQDAETVALRALSEKLHHDERVFVSLIPVGDGMTLAIKQAD